MLGHRIRPTLRGPARTAAGALLAVVVAGLMTAACVSAPGAATPAWTSAGRTAAPSSAAAGTSATPAAGTSATPAADLAGFAVSGTPPAGDLPLIDADGRPFALAALRGGPVVVYFGYTHCPDVCPATTGILVEVSRSASRAPRVVFVTVDPERDTAAILHEYVAHLPKTFAALTGPASAIRRAADGYGARYARVDTGSASGYTMAHSADTYLVDREGRLRYRFPFGTPASTYLAALAAIGG